jgi:hypothetical protein
VLQDAERADDVERVLERQRARVELQQLDIVEPPPRIVEPFREEFAADESQTRKRGADSFEHTNPVPQPISSMLSLVGKCRRRTETISRLRARNQKRFGSTSERRSKSATSNPTPEALRASPGAPVMGDRGFEPRTSALSERRSNRLS